MGGTLCAGISGTVCTGMGGTLYAGIGGTVWIGIGGTVWGGILNLIILHLRKMSYICNNTYELPKTLISQLEIFSKQLEKYILPGNKVNILSSFPPFIHDYYGNENTIAKLKI